MSPRLSARLLVPFLLFLFLLPGGIRLMTPAPTLELEPPPHIVENDLLPSSPAVPLEQSPVVFVPAPPAPTPTAEETAAVASFAAEPAAAERSAPPEIAGAPAAEEPGLEIPEEVKKLQRSIFADLWAVVYENYLYPDFNGLDWQEARRLQQERIMNGMSMEVFYESLQELVSSLGDDHSRYLTPEQAAQEDAKYAGNRGFAGIGVYLAPVPERRRATLLAVTPGSAAEEAGLLARDSILLVDGESMLDENGRLRTLLRGPEGTQVTVLVQSPGQPVRELVIPRRRVGGPLPLPYGILNSPDGGRVGYVLLLSFADSTLPARFEQAWDEMNFSGPLDGLILDNRFNEGGADTVLKGMLAYFTGGELGTFAGRRLSRPLQVEGIQRHNSQNIPLVVLIGEATFSYGEIFAGVLQDRGRAALLGHPTPGNVETLKGYNFADGSRAWIAHTSFQPHSSPDLNWEGRGIRPDEVVAGAWDLHTLETDPVIAAGLQVLREIPSGAATP